MLDKNIIRRWLIKSFILIPIYFIYKYLKIDKSAIKELKIDIGNINENSGILVEEENIVIRKKSDGKIDVISIKCTHLGCSTKYINGRFRCPCHGSEFDIDGIPIKGPATKPLKKYNFTLKNNIIYIAMLQ